MSRDVSNPIVWGAAIAAREVSPDADFSLPDEPRRLAAFSFPDPHP